MPDSQPTALAVCSETFRTAANVFQTVSGSLSRFTVQSGTRAGAWASEVAQQFGGLVSDLLSPAIFILYAFAAWSLATNLGWTDTFLFASGPLGNWLVWLSIAILVNLAGSILKKRVQSELPRR